MKRIHLIIVGIVLMYAVSRLIRLTLLPVFADEAIYIRWAQMATADPKQYLFLPLYDGKTPLFIWLLMPFLRLISVDPLWLSRSLSGVAGLLTLILIVGIVHTLKGSRLAKVLAAMLYIGLPFTFFMNRMGLIDSWLTAFLAASFLALLKWRQASYDLRGALITGVWWGLALLTKTSAFYFIPVIGGVFLVDIWRQKRLRHLSVVLNALVAMVTGLLLIGWLRVSPLFPFLFQRSGDFAFSVTEMVTQPVHILSVNSLRIGKWLLYYFTPAIPLLLLTSIKSRKVVWLLGCAGLFVLPFLISGKLLASRYFLPIVIWIIPAVALALDEWWHKNWRITAVVIAAITLSAWRFMYPLVINPGNTPFPIEDRVQYLTEWSSGYGIPEVRDYIAGRTRLGRVIVATEGYFGTLPDGLLMYFDRTPMIRNLEIFGIGQPVAGLPDVLLAKRAQGEVYLVVNQHRLIMPAIPAFMQLVGSYPRPHNGPALLLYKIGSEP